jgi:hypothetical protein
MLRTAPRTYALPYPAVFDATVAVLGARGTVTVADRDAGRVERRTALRRVTVYVGATDTTRTTVVAELAGALATRRGLDHVVDELERYLGWYYRPSA